MVEKETEKQSEMDAGSLVRSLKSSVSHILRLLQSGPERKAAVNDLGAFPVLGGR